MPQPEFRTVGRAALPSQFFDDASQTLITSIDSPDMGFDFGDAKRQLECIFDYQMPANAATHKSVRWK